MQKLKIIISLSIVGITIIFNLWLNFPETKIIADPNDNIFQYSLVYRTNWVWKNYGCPLSLSCLPNLTDHVVTTWAEGYPLPFYYSHVPQIIIVGSYNMFVEPVTKLIGGFSLYQYYNLTKYILYAFLPIPIFIALLVVGFAPIPAAISAFFAMQLSTDGLYGIDPVSQLWRGYGLTSQLYAVFFLPLALAFSYKLTKSATEKNMPRKEKIKLILLSGIFLGATTAGHLGIGIISLLSTIPFWFFDLRPQHIWIRIKSIFPAYVITLFIHAYWILPILLANSYHIISFWDPIWKFNSYGAYEVIRQFMAGEIFDFGRLPIITGLILVGFFAMAQRLKLFPFALLFIFWMVLYFGRTTWGGLIDLIPGMKDFHLHRFIVAVHMAGIFLLPAAFEEVYQLIQNVTKIPLLLWESRIMNHELRIKKTRNAGDTKEGLSSEASLGLIEEGLLNKKDLALEAKLGIPEWQDPQHNTIQIISLTLFSILLFTLLYFTVKQTTDYASLNNKWIYQANTAYSYDEQNFKDLVSYLETQPTTRIYAGRRGNWGNEFRLGSTQMYMLLGVNGFDMSQFLPETWSPLSENEQNFDERQWYDYDLLNLGLVVAPARQDFAEEVKLVKSFGPFQVYQAPTTGWFDMVASPMFVKSDKTNFTNIVHFWHRSYARLWNMHPLISIDKKPVIPAGMQRVLTMKDEVNYEEGGKLKNIFADYPFVFPEATVSGKIVSQQITKQVYQATVDVPDNCAFCYVMFKMSYHPNWHVKVDGQPAQKLAVFPFYLATPVSSGRHEVEFYYEPSRLKVFLITVEIIIISGVCTYLLILRKRIKNHEL